MSALTSPSTAVVDRPVSPGATGPATLPGALAPTVTEAPNDRATTTRPRSAPRRWRARGAAMLWGLAGIGVLVSLWALVAWRSPDLPSPVDGWNALTGLLSDPFYNAGPNDQGIGLQLATSLGRVTKGFGLAVLVGVPLGFLVGGSRRGWQAANPVIQVLRPVSPLAWFPIGLVVLEDSPNAAVFVIFITALWPIVVNTAAGAASVPADQRNVARVFKFGKLAYIRHVMVPHTLPSTVTGLRLSMGTAWMVIVAAEMLAGGSGIGFFVWNSYNAGDLSNVVAAIILIGLVGVALDAMFVRLGRRVTTMEGAA